MKKRTKKSTSVSKTRRLKKQKHRRRSKAKSESRKQSNIAEDEFKKAPHSMVFHRGKVGRYVRRLMRDMRKVMEPYTASHLQVGKKNILKDFTNIASLFNVSHFLTFQKSDTCINLHIGKVPRGPTLTFRIKDYSLVEDVLAYLKKPTLFQSTFTTHPLLVMNNFDRNVLHHKLMTTMFQNMFPSISIEGIKLSTIRRCVLLSYNKETDTIDFRHYLIRIVPSGMSRPIRKLIKPKLPDLGRYSDIAEYVDQGGNLSESEGEYDGDHNQVILPQTMQDKGNIQGTKSAIRLIEVGPRMTLKLHKIEESFWSGGVLYNAFVTKTEKDIEETETKRNDKVLLRQERTRVQNENVKRKAEARRLNKERSLVGIRKAALKREMASDDQTVSKQKIDDEDDDAQYFMDEVGFKPDEDLQLGKRKAIDRPTRSKFAKRMKAGDASNLTHTPKLSKMARQRLKTSKQGTMDKGRLDYTRVIKKGKIGVNVGKRESRGTYVNKGQRSNTRR